MVGIFSQVTLLAASGNGRDNQVNGFAIEEATSPSEAECDSWAAAIKLFYDTVYGLGGLRGLAQNAHVVKFYATVATPPNYPFYETTFNLASAPAAIDMPLEVALCASYKNVSNNAVPRARRRGRIYLSGWTEAANTAGRPGSTQYQGLATAYKDYVDDVNAISGFQAGIWSRVDDTVYPVEEVWCDNEWDTVRRRGGIATARYSLTI